METLPVIGIGTSRTFDIGSDANALENLTQVLRRFYAQGGRVIDSSPMYGSAEQVVGKLFGTRDRPRDTFVATKVWTQGRQAGLDQMNESMRKLGVDCMDLMQVHNLIDWSTHLESLQTLKSEGKIRYIGVTTSHGRDHELLEQVMKKHRLDFVQLSYNLIERAAETRLLPLALDRGIAVLVNRPFARGELFRIVANHALPDWSTQIDCDTPAQLFLKYIVSHPAVVCTIPATSKLHHMEDNMRANFGRLPDRAMRNEIGAWFRTLNA